MEIEKLWKEVTGKTMSPEVSSRILKIQKALNIRDDDGLWEIILALEFYQNLYEVWPSSVRTETEVVTNQLKEASVKVTEATAAEVKAARDKAKIDIDRMTEKSKNAIAEALGGILESKIDEAVNQLKSQSNRPLHRNWLIALGVAVLVAVGGGGWGWYKIETYYENIGSEAQKVADKSIPEKWDRWSSVTSCQGPHLEMRTKNGSRLCLSGEASRGEWTAKN